MLYNLAMSKDDFLSSKHILRRLDNLEEVPKTSVDAAISRLSEPITKVEYEERGEIKIEGDNWRIHFAYKPVTLEYIAEFGDATEWRELSSALIETPDSTIDLTQLLSHNRKIYFRPRFTEVKGWSPQNLGVLVWGDLAKPAALATLLHEIGHAIDRKQLEELGNSDLYHFMDDHEYSHEAAEIRRERVANAFALKLMRPLLNKQQRQDMILFLKHHGLRSYYESIKTRITDRDAMKEENKQWLAEQRREGREKKN